jgi:hypothetical protein
MQMRATRKTRIAGTRNSLPNHYPIPWSALHYDPAVGGFRTTVTEQMLKDAPQFSDDSWTDRNWEVQWHKHYRAPHYWERGTQ